MRPKPTIKILVLLAILVLQSNGILLTQGAELAASEIPHQVSTSGDRFKDLKASELSKGEFNVTLWIKDWNQKRAFENLNVTLFDLEHHLKSSYLSNRTGHVDLRFLPAGTYIVLVQSGNRTVGEQKISVGKSETIVVRTWAYDLNLTLVDRDSKPLLNHTVFLYDQMVFQAPNYTIVSGGIVRKQNYTIVTDRAGELVNQSETSMVTASILLRLRLLRIIGQTIPRNGTVSFVAVWNGTYRIGVLREESWNVEYVLGEPVLIHQPAVYGEYALVHQGQTNATLRFLKNDLVVKFITKSDVPVQNATVEVRDMSGHLFLRDLTNKTGVIENKNLYLIDSSYAVSARYGNRTIAYELMNASTPGTFTVRVWAYNLSVRVVDQEDRPLPEHFVFLYDQLIFYSPTNISVLPTNRTGILVNWTKTDKSGMAHFKDLWNGTYKISVQGGEVIGQEFLDLREPRSLTLMSNKTYLTMAFVTGSDEPLPNAAVYVYNGLGNLMFRDHTDKDGYIHYEGIYLEKYKVVVEWMGEEVWSGVVDLQRDRERLRTEPMRTSVFRLTLRSVDQFGNILAHADLTMRKMIYAARYSSTTLTFETNEKGYFSALLPTGMYEVSASQGIYRGSIILNLASDRKDEILCSINLSVWLAAFSVLLPLAGLTFVMERKRLRKPLEIRRYKNMLMRLESLYSSGQVEYGLYRKLREEYEAKLMELAGREMK